MARKPAPEPLKILSGTRPDRLNPEAPEEIPGRPPRPSHLDKVAAAEWDRMIPLLEGMKVLSQADGAALGLYCVAFSRWRAARLLVDKKGLVLETELGGIKPNPAVTIALQAETAMARLLAEFGCTPSSRARAKKVSEGKKSSLGEFMAKGKKGG